MKRNINTVLGPSPLLWCVPRRASGSGLKYELSNKDGEWYQLHNIQNRDLHDEDAGHLA